MAENLADIIKRIRAGLKHDTFNMDIGFDAGQMLAINNLESLLQAAEYGLAVMERDRSLAALQHNLAYEERKYAYKRHHFCLSFEHEESQKKIADIVAKIKETKAEMQASGLYDGLWPEGE